MSKANKLIAKKSGIMEVEIGTHLGRHIQYQAKEIERLRAELSKRDWVSVDERLPDDNAVVMLVWDRPMLPYETPICIGRMPARGNPRRAKITHWMPLPEPPK